MYDLMQKLEGYDALAELFNQYLNGLSTIMIMSEPTYNTMAELREHTETKPKTKIAKNFRYCAQRYYELMILRNSLVSIHRHVIEAIELLEGFYKTYDGNLLAYAIDNRFKSIEEYGSEDEKDWEEDGLDEEGKAKWKVTVRIDEEGLKYHTLYAELGRFFGDESCGRGEYIGTSTPEDFYKCSGMVAQQSEFSFRKMAEGAWGATLVQHNDDGTTSPIPVADHIEREMNTDIKAAEVVDRFNGVLLLGFLMRQFYCDSTPDELHVYSQLLEGLQIMRDVKININE